MAHDLYPSAILRLAAEIPHLGDLADAHGRSRARSMVCGSEVEVAVRLDDQGRVSDAGLEVEACALGQASASVLARHVIGASRDEIAHARDALAVMLKEGGPPPAGRFAQLAELAPVKDYPRRHASTLLAFRAAADAVDAALARATPTTVTR